MLCTMLFLLQTEAAPGIFIWEAIAQWAWGTEVDSEVQPR